MYTATRRNRLSESECQQQAEQLRLERLEEEMRAEQDFYEFDALCADYLRTMTAAEDAHTARINETQEDANGERPDYKTLPSADFPEWMRASGALFARIKQLGMNEGRVEGARQVLGLKKLSSFKQLTPAELNRVLFAINSGMVTADWELATDDEPAVAQGLEVLPTVDIVALHGTRGDENGMGFDIG